MYMEGADQFRGWFQSSLLTSVATQGVAPYREVLCHGWVVDAQGKQMHKSAGNGMEPSEIIRDYGADIIRLWVASSDYTVDVRAGKENFPPAVRGVPQDAQHGPLHAGQHQRL